MDAVTAKVKLVDGLQFVGTGSQSNHAIVMDSVAEHGGFEAGVRPMEMLLMGLGGCMGMAAISILRKKRQHVTAFEVLLTGERSESGANPYTDIAIEFVVRGTDIDDAAVQRALELSHEKYCPVSATIRNSAKVGYRYRIEEDEGQEGSK
jgi:putative redox protein